MNDLPPAKASIDRVADATRRLAIERQPTRTARETAAAAGCDVAQIPARPAEATGAAVVTVRP